MTVTIDILDGVRWDEEDAKLRTIQRSAIVSGLTPSANTAADALNELTTNGQAAGSPHPTISGLYLRERRVVDMPDSTIAKVLLTYRLEPADIPDPNSNSILEGGVSTEQEDSYFDRDGNIITVTDQSGIVHGGTIRVWRPKAAEQRTTSFQSDFPGLFARSYVGFVNDSTWNGDVEGTWLCDDIQYRILNRSTLPFPTWDFTFSFKHNSAGWDPIAIFIDPNTGRPPPDLLGGVGFFATPFYVRADFSALDLL